MMRVVMMMVVVTTIRIEALHKYTLTFIVAEMRYDTMCCVHHASLHLCIVSASNLLTSFSLT